MIATKLQNLKYRPDIEGLRAVAILLVVASHAGLPWLQGGFIGVDIFFVLSGYLITSLLVQEIHHTNDIQFLNFYARRFKRLLPALVFMVSIVCLFCTITLAPFEQLNQISSARFAILWASNIYFATSNLGYFEQGTDQDLFLHTWSLGVEEQFYLIWPALLMFLLGAWRWQGGKLNCKRLLSGMVATIFICFLLSLILSFGKPLWGFYLMPSRIWQFGLGGLCFLWPILKQHHFTQLQNTALKVVAGLAFLAIILTAILLNAENIYPGFWALIPSIATAIILFAGASLKNYTSTFLSSRPLQLIGKISYSWYLWHWPVLVLGNNFIRQGGPLYQLLLILVSLALAMFSYHFVESPLRYSKTLNKKIRLTLIGSGLVMGSLFLLTIHWQKSAISWSQHDSQLAYSTIQSDLPIIYSMGCDEWYFSSRLRPCVFGDEQAEHTAVLIGDSITAQWFPALYEIYNQPDWRLVVVTKSSCPMVDEPFFYQRIGRVYTECSIWRENALDWINSLHPDAVFIGSTTSEFTQSQWQEGTERVLDQIVDNSEKVFIIRSTFSLPFDGPACLSRKYWQKALIGTEIDCSAPAGNQFEQNVYSWLSTAAQNFDNVSLIDLNAEICPNNTCDAERDGAIIFRDRAHLSANYISSLSQVFAQKIQAALQIQ